jgi:hypothetical protein
LTVIEIHVIVIDELGLEKDEEHQLLNIFRSKKYRSSLILDVFKNGTEEEQNDLCILYSKEVLETLQKAGFDMDVLEKRAYKFAEMMGVIDKLKEKLKGEVLNESRAEFQKEAQKAQKEFQKLLKKERRKARIEKQKAEADKQKADIRAKRRAEIEKRKTKLKTAINMKKNDLDIDLIVKITEMDKKYLEKFFRKVG